nr:hybrid sensor histidine kinase/response regulator [uncultured Arsenicibacter sp.]
MHFSAFNEDHLRGSRVLLVEDNLMNQFFARQLMEDWHIIVDIAQNGIEAVEMVIMQVYDLILMDIQMPRMDGLQATRMIRQQHRLTTPIIALTALSAREDIDLFRQAGMDDYLIKPFLNEELRKKLVTFIPKPKVKATDFQKNSAMSHAIVPLFNKGRLAAMLNNDEGRILQMENLFIQQARDTVMQMQESLQHMEWDRLSKLAHKIKASVDLMDIASLKRPVRDLEAGTKSPQPGADFTQLTNQVCQTLEQVCQQIEASR